MGQDSRGCLEVIVMPAVAKPGRSPQILAGQDPSEQDQPSPRGLSLDAGSCRPWGTTRWSQLSSVWKYIVQAL